MDDRYLKGLLTVIAIELLWLALGGGSGRASAQSTATPVIITGIRLESADGGTLPVAVHGTVTIAPAGPVKVEADRPVPVEAVPYKPSVRPGE